MPIAVVGKLTSSSADEYFALLSVADLALVTSVRDGMNTTRYAGYALLQPVLMRRDGGCTVWNTLYAKRKPRTH